MKQKKQSAASRVAMVSAAHHNNCFLIEIINLLLMQSEAKRSQSSMPFPKKQIDFFFSILLCLLQ